MLGCAVLRCAALCRAALCRAVPRRLQTPTAALHDAEEPLWQHTTGRKPQVVHLNLTDMPDGIVEVPLAHSTAAMIDLQLTSLWQCTACCKSY